jgi:hypothetical protein
LLYPFDASRKFHVRDTNGTLAAGSNLKPLKQQIFYMWLTSYRGPMNGREARESGSSAEGVGCAKSGIQEMD